MFKKKIEESIGYLYEIRRQIWFSVYVFFLATFGGYYFAQNFPVETQEYLNEINEFFDSMEDETVFQMFTSIFENNAIAMLRVIAFGIFAGVFSIFFLLSNGFILGLMSQVLTQQISWTLLFFGILPHGIIELPCMFISAAIGLSIGKTALKKLFGRKADLTAELAHGLEFSVTVIIPLLLLAAFIEAYITPFMMEAVVFIEQAL